MTYKPKMNVIAINNLVVSKARYLLLNTSFKIGQSF